jgi:hypothetical protein
MALLFVNRDEFLFAIERHDIYVSQPLPKKKLKLSSLSWSESKTYHDYSNPRIVLLWFTQRLNSAMHWRGGTLNTNYRPLASKAEMNQTRSLLTRKIK